MGLLKPAVALIRRVPPEARSTCWRESTRLTSVSSSGYTSNCFSSFTSTNEDHAIDQINHEEQDRLEIRKTAVGWGLFATRNFDANEWVMTANIVHTSSEPDVHTIQLDENQHAHIDMPARFINHYCGQANVGILFTDNNSRSDKKGNSGSAFHFHARRPIHVQEQLFFDYETTEFQLSAPFHCSCGSPDCREEVSGFRYHGQHVMEIHGQDFIAPYLVEWLHNT